MYVTLEIHVRVHFPLYFEIYSKFEAEVFWIIMRKILGFHLISKFVLLWVEPWGMRLQWEHPALTVLRIVVKLYSISKNYGYQINIKLIVVIM